MHGECIRGKDEEFTGERKGNSRVQTNKPMGEPITNARRVQYGTTVNALGNAMSIVWPSARRCKRKGLTHRERTGGQGENTRARKRMGKPTGNAREAY